MTDEISFPPLHDPAPGEFERRRRHLLSEVTRRQERARRSFTLPRARVAVLAGAVVALAAGAAALSIALGGGSVAEAAPLLVQTPSGKTVSVPATSPTAATTEIVGGTDSEQALMRAIVDGMQPTAIEKIELVSNGSDVALHFTFTGPSPQAFWEDSLVADAFRDRARAAGDDVSVSIYDGVAYGASPNPGLTTLPPAQPGDAAAARQLFEDAATQSGVPLDSLTVYEPDGIAVAATFTSSDPASFLLHQMRDFLGALDTSRSHLDGMYLSLVDGSGNTVWEAFWNLRSSQGSVGSIPALAGCSPVTHGGGGFAPVCPAS
jgi:hypothetical protein